MNQDMNLEETLEDYFRATEELLEIQLEIVKLIIELINTFYKEHNDHYFKVIEPSTRFNLNKKRIDHLMCTEKKSIIDDDLSEYCFKYRNSLNTLERKLLKRLSKQDEDSGSDLSQFLKFRVKQAISISSKWEKYISSDRHSYGKIPLQKCLNDLMGFRYLISEREKMNPLIKEFCDSMPNLKFVEASKGQYKATHVYIKGRENYYFPWELQIWDEKDFINNDLSHAIYKQDYLKELKVEEDWEKVYDKSEKKSRGSSNV